MSDNETLKVVYLYGLAKPDGSDLYDKISECVFKNKLVREDLVEDFMDHQVLEMFFRRIESLSGFEELDYSGAWDPDTGKPAFILVLAREKAPTDGEEIEKIKSAIKAVKEELDMEGIEKWYIEQQFEIDDEHITELAGKFDTPLRFT